MQEFVKFLAKAATDGKRGDLNIEELLAQPLTRQELYLSVLQGLARDPKVSAAVC